MKLTKYRLGDFVELYNEKCGNANLTAWDISGVNSDKLKRKLIWHITQNVTV